MTNWMYPTSDQWHKARCYLHTRKWLKSDKPLIQAIIACEHAGINPVGVRQCAEELLNLAINCKQRYLNK